MVRRIKRGTYIHERANWPEFRWDSERISQQKMWVEDSLLLKYNERLSWLYQLITPFEKRGNWFAQEM